MPPCIDMAELMTSFAVMQGSFFLNPHVKPQQKVITSGIKNIRTDFMAHPVHELQIRPCA